MRRAIAPVILLGMVVMAVGLAARPSRPASTPTARVNRIAAALRCPVCQGLSVADSPSDVAGDIRADIGRRVTAGETDAEIRRAYMDRYGEWILLRPRSRGIGVLLWALPAVAIVVAVSCLAFVLRRWRRQPVLHSTPEDEALVADHLARQRDRS